jgi:acetylornithine deacetylase/succinyl-diaminopimelate desuccinylase-like protein
MSSAVGPAAIRELLLELVAIDSVNPTLVAGGAGEAEIARFVAGWLERNGVAAEYHDLGGGCANVVGRVPGRGHGRALLEGGHEPSTYPDRCVVKIERRTLPGETVGDVEKQLTGIAGDDATVKTLFAREPLATAPDESIVVALIEQATAVLDRRPEVVGVPFWTDAALLSAAGIPSVVFGPRGAGAHADVEWVDLDDLVGLAEILLATASDFCS